MTDQPDWAKWLDKDERKEVIGHIDPTLDKLRCRRRQLFDKANHRRWRASRKEDAD